MILDTSVIFKWYVKKNELETIQADLILKKFIQGKEIIRIPDLLIYELTNALSYCDRLTSANKQKAILHFFDLKLEIIPINKETICQALATAQKHKITIYDAIYIVLAQEFNEPLVTANPKHQKISDSCKIIQLNDYA